MSMNCYQDAQKWRAKRKASIRADSSSGKLEIASTYCVSCSRTAVERKPILYDSIRQSMNMNVTPLYTIGNVLGQEAYTSCPTMQQFLLRKECSNTATEVFRLLLTNVKWTPASPVAWRNRFKIRAASVRLELPLRPQLLYPLLVLLKLALQHRQFCTRNTG
jgi:hypothetical protein